MKKAKKLYTDYGKYSNIVTYEYRGCKYEVEYAVDMSYCVSPAWVQHKIAQEKIDDKLDNPRICEGENCEVGFNLFWDYVNGEEY